MQMESQVIQVNIDDIIPNRFQPRISFDEQGLQELASSIKEHGIIQPLVLRKLGNKYEIIAGERRYKAATLAGLTTVPAVISNMDDNTSAEVALVENIQRRDLTPIEEARSYKNLLDKGYLTQEDLAKKMGLSQSAVSNKLRLLNLDDSVQQALLEGKISERHARSLLNIENKAEQKEWLNKIISERLTVRQLDQEIKKYNLGPDTASGDVPLVNLDINIDDIKNNAQDINKKSNNNVASMMVPEETMTEYTDSLNIKPSLETQLENTTPIEDNKNIPPIDFMAPLSNEPIVESTGKFFTQPQNDTEQEVMPSIDSIFGASNPPKSDIEIFDLPMNDSNNTKSEELTEIQPTNSLDDPLSSELNPNNKFFQPINNESQIDRVEESTSVGLVNPMDFVEELVPSNQDFSITLNEIKAFIESLQNKGAKINTTETDLGTKYNISIEIDKDN